MKQVLTLSRHNIKTAFKDKVFIAVTGLFLIMSVLSVLIGSSTKDAEMKAYKEIVSLLNAQGATTLPNSPDIAPLAILKNIIEYISIIGAVVAVFLGFDAFNGERENGTLPLILTRPLYRDQLLTGKIAGGAGVIGLLLGIMFIFNILLYVVVTGLSFRLNELARLGVFIVLAFLYLMSFYIASLYVSIKMRNKTFAFITMMIVWLFVCFVVPQLADTQRNFIYAVNSTAQTITQTASDTPGSAAIEVLSPAVQFQNIGGDLLQVSSETISMGSFQILGVRMLNLFNMLIPGIVLLLISYRAVQKESVL